jgi:hypothetical protein
VKEVTVDEPLDDSVFSVLAVTLIAIFVVSLVLNMVLSGYIWMCGGESSQQGKDVEGYRATTSKQNELPDDDTHIYEQFSKTATVPDDTYGDIKQSTTVSKSDDLYGDIKQSSTVPKSDDLYGDIKQSSTVPKSEDLYGDLQNTTSVSKTGDMNGGGSSDKKPTKSNYDQVKLNQREQENPYGVLSKF